MHVAGTGRLAERGANAARKLWEKRRFTDDVVSTFRIPYGNCRIEFGNEVPKRATRAMTERDSARVAAARLAHHFYRRELALDFVVVLDTLFDRAVNVCDSVSLLHNRLQLL